MKIKVTAKHYADSYISYATEDCPLTLALKEFFNAPVKVSRNFVTINGKSFELDKSIIKQYLVSTILSAPFDLIIPDNIVQQLDLLRLRHAA